MTPRLGIGGTQIEAAGGLSPGLTWLAWLWKSSTMDVNHIWIYMGGFRKWLVYFIANPLKIRMIWGYPYFRKPPYGCLWLRTDVNYLPKQLDDYEEFAKRAL